MEKSSSRLQEEVDEVTVIMHENLNRVEERSEKLSDLDKRSDLLRTHSARFSKTARKVKVEKQKENRKMKLLLAGGVLLAVLVLIIIIAIVCSKSVDEGAKTTIATTVNVSEGEGGSQRG